MIKQLTRTLVLAGVLTTSVTPFAISAPQAEPNHKIVGGVEIYLGVLSAETMRSEYTKARKESAMHGGIPVGRDYYHVNVTLFDSRTNVQIRNAQVEARISEIGGTGELKNLEPTTINNTVSYGNYFRMSGKNPYWITVQIQRPGSSRKIQARFEHRTY